MQLWIFEDESGNVEIHKTTILKENLDGEPILTASHTGVEDLLEIIDISNPNDPVRYNPSAITEEPWEAIPDLTYTIKYT